MRSIVIFVVTLGLLSGALFVAYRYDQANGADIPSKNPIPQSADSVIKVKPITNDRQPEKAPAKVTAVPAKKPAPTPSPTGRVLTDQPDLDEQIAMAKKIAFDIVGPPSKDIFVRMVDQVRNTKTGAYNFIVWYDLGYHTPSQAVCVDTAKKKAKAYTIDYVDPKKAKGMKNHINMVPDYRMGKYVFKNKIIYPVKAHNWKYSKDCVLVYDAPSNTLYKAAEVPKNVSFSTLASSYCADRNVIRVLGRSYDGGDGFRYYEFNCKTGKMKIAEPFHLKVPKYNEYVGMKTRSIGDWTLSGIGPNPFILIAHNFKTGEYKRLLQLETTDVYTMAVNDHSDGSFYITTRNPTPRAWFFKDGVFSEGTPLDKWKSRKMRLPGRMQDMEFDSYPKITIKDKWAFKPGQDDIVHINWFDAKDKEHKIAVKNVQGHVFDFKMVNSCGDVLYGKPEAYFQGLFYNVKTGESRPTGVYGSVYHTRSFGTTFYEACYPDFETRRIDLSDQSLKSAPEEIRYGQLKAQNSHRPIAGIEQGCDGNIYLAGEYSRTRKGGGLAWFDPETKEAGGLQLDPWNPYWLASVQKGRYMIMSCKQEGGTFVIYDVETKKLTDHKMPEGILPGYICGINGDHIIGWGIKGDKGSRKGVIYRYDPIAKKIIWQKNLAMVPEIGKKANENRNLSILFDGKESVYMNGGKYEGDKSHKNNTLLKININSGHVDVMGKIAAYPIAMVNGEIYSAGYEGFARLKLPH